MNLEQLRERLVSYQTDAKAIMAIGETEERDLTEEEEASVNELFDKFNATQVMIRRRERLEENETLLNAPSREAVKPDPQAHNPVQAIPKPQTSPARIDLVETKLQRERFGWDSFGQFAMAVKAAANPGTNPDRRLLMAPTTAGSEGVGADGGYAVPPDFQSRIKEALASEDSLLGITDNVPVSGNTFTLPVDETTPWQTSGGVLAYWEDELDQITQSKPNLKSLTVRANKLAVLIPVSEELLDDTTALEAYLGRKASAKIVYKVNDSLINGDGVGKPLGILNSSAAVEVAKETSQTAATINYPNVVKMYNRLYAPYRNRAVWLINQDAETQLDLLAFPNASGTEPAYLPAGATRGTENSLKGRPVVRTQACQTLGTVGDIILWAPQEYLTVTKGGIRSDVSVHLYFDYDAVAFRYILRVGGQPYLSSSISPANGSTTYSSIVTLAVRA